ncbi:serine/threonine protein kinase [Streptomyces pratensis]|uniref:serine/threonine protein kinase n=1 Tax=Streptomyces pratensis TaxID=1169025 RepID=UPI001933021A|nr:serine/threonine-protein kinase [Streptomyces pratensis]
MTHYDHGLIHGDIVEGTAVDMAGLPDRIGPYRPLRRLGAGGMGTVYLAHPPGATPVAVKVLHPEFASDAVHRRRFAREVATLTKISGPYLLELTAADAQADRPWLATPYVAGSTLTEHVQAHGPLTGTSLATFAAATAHALICIHRAGVAHRDLKPTNVILAADGPRVVDFGIAHHLDATAVTATRMTTGTPGWMAPEQLERAATTTASDLFAWGLLTAYAATGQHPFGAPLGIEYRIVTGVPKLVGIPGQLAALVAAALSKDPAARPSASELASQAAALNGAAGVAAFPTLTDARTTILPPLPAILWAPPAALPGHDSDASRTAIETVTAAAQTALDPQVRVLTALEDIESIREQAVRTSERLAMSLTSRDSGYAEAAALRSFIGMHAPKARLASMALNGGNEAWGVNALQSLLENSPQRAAHAITFFRGPGAPVLKRTGYQGNVLDLAHRLITITYNALPAIAEYMAHHNTDFPELPDALRRTWQNAATAASQQPAPATPPPAVGGRRGRWWRG